MKQNGKFLIGMFLGICIAGAASFLYLSDVLKEKYIAQIRYQQGYIDQQAIRLDSGRQIGTTNLLHLVLANVREELGKTQERTLRDETIEQISALSYSFISHTYLENDGIPANTLSPERGTLLLLLATMHIDSGSLKKIMTKTSFAGAVLRDADLEGKNLVGVDLRGADLQDANLQGANLNAANLSFANMWGANLQQAKLIGTNLKRADLRWSTLNEADFEKSDLREADLTSAKLRKTKLRGATLKWADLNGAFLNEADLTGADLFRSNLVRAQMTGTILNTANMSLTNMSEANLINADLTGAILNDAVVSDKNWLNHLTEWQVKGANENQLAYKLEEENFNGKALYRLKIMKH
ncbi:MAG: pentapeptide repeat-containing protein [Saprospiraceae bacterium]|nr:pentapeptide repeat-containing protein [Saprospiraceae bacterium]